MNLSRLNVMIPKITWLTLAACLLVFLLAGQCFSYELPTAAQGRQAEAERAHAMDMFAITGGIVALLGLIFAVLSGAVEKGRSVLLLVVFITMLALVLCAGQCFGAGLERCIDSTCRITAGDGGVGSGVVFEHSQDTVFVLTCAHVVKGSKTVRCEFWGNGEVRKPVTGYVVKSVENDTVDAAVVAISDNQFNGAMPTVIPVASRETRIDTGATVLSVGCARGSWPTAWRGKILRSQYGDLRFWPVPADGRSGAAIFSADGSKIIGLIRARTADGREGIACSLKAIYAALGPPRVSPPPPGPENARPHPKYCCPDGLCLPDT